MYDLIEEYQGNLFQHGKNSNRIYLLKYHKHNDLDLINYLHSLAEVNQYTKIILKLPESSLNDFIRYGYDIEGEIPGFYNGKEKCCFLAKFLNSSRKQVNDLQIISKIINDLKNKKPTELPHLSNDFSIRKLKTEDSREMAMVFKDVFESYPFPIYDPNYLVQTMHSHINYYGVIHNDKIAAIASSEIDGKNQNVEMTDFAIPPAYRGYKLSKHLLYHMEIRMKEEGIRTFYTIARAISYPMNSTFNSLGYKYGGTLYNNTQISGSIESMNLWYKETENSRY